MSIEAAAVNGPTPDRQQLDGDPRSTPALIGGGSPRPKRVRPSGRSSTPSPIASAACGPCQHDPKAFHVKKDKIKRALRRLAQRSF